MFWNLVVSERTRSIRYNGALHTSTSLRPQLRTLSRIWKPQIVLCKSKGATKSSRRSFLVSWIATLSRRVKAAGAMGSLSSDHHRDSAMGTIVFRGSKGNLVKFALSDKVWSWGARFWSEPLEYESILNNVGVMSSRMGTRSVTRDGANSSRERSCHCRARFSDGGDERDRRVKNLVWSYSVGDWRWTHTINLIKPGKLRGWKNDDSNSH